MFMTGGGGIEKEARGAHVYYLAGGCGHFKLVGLGRARVLMVLVVKRWWWGATGVR